MSEALTVNWASSKAHRKTGLNYPNSQKKPELQSSPVSYPLSDSALSWLEKVFAERFGHSWKLERKDQGLRLQLVSAEGAILFDELCEGFTQAHSEQPCTHWNMGVEGWASAIDGPLPAPGVSNLRRPLIEASEAGHVVHYDIPGLTYWMLARVEEIGRTDLDNHERFPATSSHALKHGYLDRPVVDEWLYVLGQVIQRQWPTVPLKQHQARTLVSCDVDSPFALNGSLRSLMRRAGGDILKRRSMLGLKRTVVGAWHSSRGDNSMDPHRQGIEYIMELNELAGRAVAFYFIPENTDLRLDNRISLDDLRMRALLREIHARGHEIGIHPGYNTYCHPGAMYRSVQTLRRVLDEERIDQPTLGGRQHFLRWEMPTTARLWSDNGLDYDSTLGFADRAGFRCGTSHEYPAYDPVERRPLSLRLRPLIVMECTLVSPRYMGLGYGNAAYETVFELKDRCRKYGGIFSLLWHNSHFTDANDRALYEAALDR